MSATASVATTASTRNLLLLAFLLGGLFYTNRQSAFCWPRANHLDASIGSAAWFWRLPSIFASFAKCVGTASYCGRRTNYKCPWLREELQAALQNLLSERLVWPNRIVNSMLQEPSKAEFNATMLSSQELRQLERADPLLTEMHRGAIQQRNKASKSRLTKKEDASSPWNQLFDGFKRPF